ncbi:hypothetical protein Cylst_0788 [Cylindrospermum stagnale PCC 7417]|uniref:Uncharacterized protein n=1 Tax=Cylindrospermum stagnale PCC 7417 TaxID=56107 RepID=K9WRX5_9NOST|nr:hypothetical protein Cylst_0788 [Cylindrospermum stagnale PCC 7417]
MCRSSPCYPLSLHLYNGKIEAVPLEPFKETFKEISVSL